MVEVEEARVVVVVVVRVEVRGHPQVSVGAPAVEPPARHVALHQSQLGGALLDAQHREPEVRHLGLAREPLVHGRQQRLSWVVPFCFCFLII